MATRKARAAAETLPTPDLPAQEASAPEAGQPVAARVLVTCYLGRPNDVVTLDAAALAVALGAGLIDPNPEAVAAALR